jgi:hypothetical protein
MHAEVGLYALASHGPLLDSFGRQEHMTGTVQFQNTCSHFVDHMKVHSDFGRAEAPMPMNRLDFAGAEDHVSDYSNFQNTFRHDARILQIHPACGRKQRPTP